MRKNVPKKMFILCVICCTLCIFVMSALAQEEEDVGFVKRMWRKGINRGKAKEKTPTPKEVIMTEEVEVTDKERALPKKALIPAKPTSSVAIPEGLDKDYMLEVMYANLDAYGDELVARFPILTKEVDPEGKTIFKFKMKTGELVDIEELDKEELFEVYRALVNESNAIRMERLNMQMQQIQQTQQQLQQIQQQTRTMSQTRLPAQPPRPPQTHKPPKAPTPPPAPPRPPRR